MTKTVFSKKDLCVCFALLSIALNHQLLQEFIFIYSYVCALLSLALNDQLLQEFISIYSYVCALLSLASNQQVLQEFINTATSAKGETFVANF